MAPDAAYDALAADIVSLGRALPRPAPGADLTVAVMERIADAPAPVTASRQQRLLRDLVDTVARTRRRAVVVVAALFLALLAAPPVRAAVADWLGFAGVSVRLDPTPGPSVASPPPTVDTATDIDDAGKMVAFVPGLPAALGRPQGVEVSDDRRLLSMSWTDGLDGVVRLDQFDGRLDYSFAKRSPGVEFTSVDGAPAMWFAEPHAVVVLNPDGTSRTETARLAGHTLIWEFGGTAMRLEGDLRLTRAIEIARSVTALP